jgi:hypothetical protein
MGWKHKDFLKDYDSSLWRSEAFFRTQTQTRQGRKEWQKILSQCVYLSWQNASVEKGTFSFHFMEFAILKDFTCLTHHVAIYLDVLGVHTYILIVDAWESLAVETGFLGVSFHQMWRNYLSLYQLYILYWLVHIATLHHQADLEISVQEKVWSGICQLNSNMNTLPSPGCGWIELIRIWMEESRK